ncbi:MAG: DUF4402 domain-containing protein [Pseudomonadota bacterium]
MLFRQNTQSKLWVSLLAITLSLILSCPALAQRNSSKLTVVKNKELNFGTFMVFGSGSRRVSAAGAVVDQAVVDLEGSPASPGQFTVVYDRGNAAYRPVDVTVEIVISAPAQVRERGVDARISSLSTNLEDHGQVVFGQAITLQIRNCRSRRCTRSFNVGAQLNVSRHFGGNDVVIPIDVDARLVAVDAR